MDSFDLKITKYRNREKALGFIKDYLDKNLAIINFHFEVYAKYLTIIEWIESGLSPTEAYQNTLLGITRNKSTDNEEDEILFF